jgi:hypothetical protein
MMNPPPSLMEACYCDSKNPTKNAAHSTDVTSGDIKKYNLMQHRGGNATPGSLRPGISSSRSHDALLLFRQGPEEQEEPEVLLSSFAHRSSPASSEDHHNNCGSTFLRMLLKMLEDAESKDFENVVSWVPGQNNLFRVYDSETFTREVAPLYFKCTQYKSFQRQLNLYGFSRIKTGIYKGGYAHERLVRGSPELNNCCSTFPRMLLKMLEDAESKGFENVVSWVPGHNKLFRVYDSETFTREIAPLYFKCTQYKSFQRQLNLYGFSRIKTGLYKGGYTHELLVRGSPELCECMIRTKVKKGGKSLRSPVSSMLSLTAPGKTFRPLFSQEKGEETSRLPTSLEYRYQCKQQENTKYATITEECIDSCNNTSQARDPTAVFDHRHESHPHALQPKSLSSPSANHNDGWVTNPSNESSIENPPIVPSPLRSSRLAFGSNTNYGGFPREEIIDEIIHTFCR